MSHTATVNDLLGQIRAGDAGAYRELIRLRFLRLRAIVRQLLTDFQSVRRWVEVDEVLNEYERELCVVVTARPPRDAAEFYRVVSWLYRHRLLDLARRFNGPRSFEGRHATPPAAGETPPGWGDPAVGPPDDLAAAVARLVDEVDRLPPDERAVIDLRHFQGLSNRDAAAALGLPEAHVRVHYVHALRRLRAAFGADRPPTF